MSKVNSKRKNAILLLVITAFFWSLGGIFIKSIQWNAAAISGGRSLIAAVVIWFFMDKPLKPFNKDKFLGALFYTLTVILFVAATKNTTAANAILLQYTAPIYIIIFGYTILGEKSYVYDYITVVSVIGGMLLFFVNSLKGGMLVGNIMAILSGVAFAFTAIFMRKQKNYNPLESVFWGNIFTAVICSYGFFSSPPQEINSYIYLLILGVFQLGFPYVLYSKAVKNVSAIEISLIPIIEPLLNPVWVLLFYREVPSSWSILGGIIVITSVTVRTLYVLSLDKKSK